MKLTVIHTTPATINSLGQLIHSEMPEIEVNHILDDSILGDMNAGKNVAWVRERWLEYARIACRNGAQAVLSACSTVGEFAQEADAMLPIPVYRIDEAMAREAVRRGGVIAVFATLASTLQPTERLIRRLAQESGAGCTIRTVLVEGAYDALMRGDRTAHDSAIARAMARQAPGADTLVLAQASMASAAQALDPAFRNKVLTSPLLGVRKLKEDLAGLEGKADGTRLHRN